MKTTSRQPAEITREVHEQLAHQLWEKAQRPQGKSLDFWLEAEQQLQAAPKAKRKPSGKKSAAKRKQVTTALAKAASRLKSAPAPLAVLRKPQSAGSKRAAREDQNIAAS